MRMQATATEGRSQATAKLRDALAKLEQGISANPNDVRYAEPLQQLLAATNRSPETLRLLYYWFTSPDLQPGAKGSLLLLVVDQLRRDAHHYDPRLFGLDVTRKDFEAIHNGIKHHLDAAVNEIRLLGRL